MQIFLVLEIFFFGNWYYQAPFSFVCKFFGTQEMQPQLDEIDAIETSVDELLNTAQVTT